MAVLAPGESRAQSTFYWDANAGAAGTGGTGNWETTTALWRLTTTGGALTVWSNGGTTDYAILEGTAGTVTVTQNISVRRITFGTTGYTITGGAGTLTLVTDGYIYTGANTATISAPLAGTVRMRKYDAGTLVLSGASTFTGPTEIYGGTVSFNTIGNVSGGVSSLGAPTSVANGTIRVGNTTTAGTLAYTGSGSTSDRVVNLGGTTGGATIDASGTGALVFTSNFTATGGGSKTLTLSGTNTAANTIGGVIVNNSGANITSVTKSGTGTWVLSGNSTYTGLTTISAGTLKLGATGTASNTPLGTTTAGTTVTSGATLDLNGYTLGTAESLTLSGLGVASAGALLNNGAGAVTYSGAVTLGAVAPYIGGTGNILLTGAIGDGTTTSFTKVGSNTLALSASNTYTGGTTISAGILEARSNNALGTAGNITVSTGGQLSLNAASLVLGTNAQTLFLSGSGGGTGALINNYATAGGTNAQIYNSIRLNGNTTVNSGTTSGNTLQLGVPGSYSHAPDSITENSTIDLQGNTLTFNGSTGTSTKIEGKIFGTGNVVINTSGNVNYFNPRNTYTGSTTVQNGTLLIDTASNGFAPNDTGHVKYYGISGPLIIGDDIGSANTAIVHLGDGVTQNSVNEGIKSDVPITIYSDGVLYTNGNPQTIGTLTMTGGTITTGADNLFLDYANTAVVITPTATSGPSTLNGKLSLTFHRWSPSEDGILHDRTFNVGYNAANVLTGDLVINALVTAGSITKTGIGTMVLKTNNNDYTGTTTINNGILNVQVGTNGSDKSSLGLSGGGSSMDTTVNTGGTLQLQGGIAITKEGLTLAGTGYNTTQGALENFSGNNTWGSAGGVGGIVLSANARIGSTADLLTIPTTISSTGGNWGLTISGAGNTTITGDVNTGSGAGTTLTKVGNGILTLSGNNGYQGLTDLQAGIIVAASNNALGSTTDGTSVTSNAELRLTNNITVPGEALTLNGTGFGGGSTGALRNFSGSNTYQGVVTINSAGTRINSDTGLLTLTGGISTGGNAFVVGGSGNTTETGAVGGSGALTKDGTGTATFSNITGVGNVTMNKGTLTFSGSSTTGSTVNMNEGTLNFNGATATVGQVHLLGGALSTISVGTSATLNTNEFDSSVSSTLAIASGGSVVANYNTGNTFFSGQITGSGGTFKALGTGQVTFNQTIINTGLTVFIGGTSIGTNATPITFTITGATTLQFGTIHITGDTILDFGNSSASVLNSANLIIDAGVKITVNNWISLTDAWYATSSFTGGVLDRTAGTPENQITFNGFSNNSTTWATVATYGYFEHEIRPVPEPSTYGAIFISGCIGVIGLRRYRRHLATKAK